MSCTRRIRNRLAQSLPSPETRADIGSFLEGGAYAAFALGTFLVLSEWLVKKIAKKPNYEHGDKTQLALIILFLLSLAVLKVKKERKIRRELKTRDDRIASLEEKIENQTAAHVALVHAHEKLTETIQKLSQVLTAQQTEFQKKLLKEAEKTQAAIEKALELAQNQKSPDKNPDQIDLQGKEKDLAELRKAQRKALRRVKNLSTLPGAPQLATLLQQANAIAAVPETTNLPGTIPPQPLPSPAAAAAASSRKSSINSQLRPALVIPNSGAAAFHPSSPAESKQKQPEHHKGGSQSLPPRSPQASRNSISGGGNTAAAAAAIGKFAPIKDSPHAPHRASISHNPGGAAAGRASDYIVPVRETPSPSQ